MSSPGGGLLHCSVCALLSRPASAAQAGRCPRCGSALQRRRAHSVPLTWALLVAAAACYVPASMLPVLVTEAFGSPSSETILGGAIFLLQTGSWPLALVVLVASVMVPLGKIAVLAWLLLAVQFRRPGSAPERTRLYRGVLFIGRWSMLDVFVDTFTVALVQLQPLMSVRPGPGVAFFGAVVVLTMLAAHSFDSRLVWDTQSSHRD